MMNNRNGSEAAKKLLQDIGFDEITNFSLKTLIAGLGGTLIEEKLSCSDGKKVKGRTKTIIKVNSEIPYETKKRFTIAHEIGHLIMHKGIHVPADNYLTLNWFQCAENQLKSGSQEWEANDFASELLMPEALFRKETFKKSFSPELLSGLAERFNTSITSTVYRYLHLDLHPILVVMIVHGKVKYYSKSHGLYYRVKDIKNLDPPSDSVAQEYIEGDYEFIYTGKEKMQEIFKSTWFELKESENDSPFYEYCIPTKQYETIVSVVWEK